MLRSIYTKNRQNTTAASTMCLEDDANIVDASTVLPGKSAETRPFAPYVPWQRPTDPILNGTLPAAPRVLKLQQKRQRYDVRHTQHASAHSTVLQPTEAAHNCNATCCASNVTGRPLNQFGLRLECCLNVLPFQKMKKHVPTHPRKHTRKTTYHTYTPEYVLVLHY